jgi:hypothetical protein
VRAAALAVVAALLAVAWPAAPACAAGALEATPDLATWQETLVYELYPPAPAPARPSSDREAP